MTFKEMAYSRGVNDAFDKFAAPTTPAAPTVPAAGSLGAVPSISPSVPGMPSASVKPAAPNQALATSPVLSTGVPGTPTLAGMGKTQTQGSIVSAPAPAAAPSPAVSGMAKAAAMFAPTKPPRAAKIPVVQSTIGSNNTLETVKSVAPSSASATPTATSSSSSASIPGGMGTGGMQFGGIVPSTGVVPAAALANETASNTRNQVVSVSGGGK